MKRIVIKIGSRVLTKKDGHLNKEVLANLVADIAELKQKKDVEIIIVSSGAVSIGRSVEMLNELRLDAETIKYDKKILEEQILASVGQPLLMDFYIQELAKYRLYCAQLLATRAVFADRNAYLNLRTVTENLVRAGIIPIFNENDVLSPEELDFSDNDQLACMVTAMTVADKLIILTNVDGVYDGPPSDPNSQIAHFIDNINNFLSKVDKNATTGKGGMASKLMSADMITSLGIPMHIANGFTKSVISRILSEENIGTFIPAKNRKVNAMKNWLATGAHSGGKIVVSTYLADILRNKQTASVLFAGIERIEGDFRDKDVVEVCDDNGKVLGRGLSRFDAIELKSKLEKYKKKTDEQKARSKSSKLIAVHYDYFVFR